MRFGIGVAALAAACGVSMGCAGLPAAVGLDERVSGKQAASVAPALGAVVVACGRQVNHAQSGVTRLDTAAPISDRARFAIGSNAKSMLASLAAIYVQSGRLRWDTTVGEVLLAEVAQIDTTLRGITVEQLLTHRSGLPAYSSGVELDTVIVRADEPATAQRLEFAMQVLRGVGEHAPGERFVYSNAGYVVLGAMLERLDGRPIELQMRDRLFHPLGMDSAGFGAPSIDERGQPIGHVVKDGEQVPYLDPTPAIPLFLTPAGDVSLTLDDYGRYLREHLCALRGRDDDLLSARAVDYMHRPIGEDGSAMGWGRFAFDGVPASIHVGGTGAFSSFVAVIPSRNLAVATVVNSGEPMARSAALDLLNALVAR